MSGTVAGIWREPPPPGIFEQIRATIDSSGKRPLQVFFRADDIAVVDTKFTRLMSLFRSRRVPLCLAVVPDWLDRERWEAMRAFDPADPLWCWHQHGRSHTNHEAVGKKCEFGESRSREAISRDLYEGRERLAGLMGDLFFPVFTPPWNRCSRTTLELLRDLRFSAVSRSDGANPPATGILPDFAVNVDLHTRKESNAAEGWQNLLQEFSAAVESGRMGIMLHHQIMNENAFAFLDTLLGELNGGAALSYRTFRELL